MRVGCFNWLWLTYSVTKRSIANAPRLIYDRQGTYRGQRDSLKFSGQSKTVGDRGSIADPVHEAQGAETNRGAIGEH